MFYIIFLILFTFISEYLTYRFIRKIDKKERQKLQDWEMSYIDEYKRLVDKK